MDLSRRVGTCRRPEWLTVGVTSRQRDTSVVGGSVKPSDLLEIGRRLFTATAARDWPDFVALIHPDAELELRSQPGRIIHGRTEMEAFAREVIAQRWAHEITVDEIEQIDADAVIALGRLFFTDENGIHDMHVGWLMLFEEGMLRKSVAIESAQEGRERLASLRVSQTPA